MSDQIHTAIPTQAEIDRGVARGQRLRSQAFLGMLNAIAAVFAAPARAADGAQLQMPR